MEKKKYYVAVESGQILEDQGASSYELEIEATEEERQQLEKLFSKKNTENIDLFIDPHAPNKWDEIESDVQNYNDFMMNIYAMIYRLGTPETKDFIERNDILTKLKNQWQDYDFS
ncbi:hydrolase [Caldalkalibacillus salinus]|uniref:hydrolase n=1 Tax=Caldalkalibacillus salinus TaxID=2803787 RepID=UPI00192143C0|nr:hydrolase [Caldalkalibacillus salinus]